MSRLTMRRTAAVSVIAIGCGLVAQSLIGCSSSGDVRNAQTEEKPALTEEALTQVKLHPVGRIPETAELMRSRLRTVAAPGLPGVAAVLPASVDLSSELPPVGDQGTLGSCVGWAVGYYTKTLQEVVEMKWPPHADDHEFSASWLFNQVGGSISAAMNLIVNSGADTISSFPYNQNDWTTQPGPDSMARAAHYKAATYYTLANTANDFKTTLAGGNTVVIGFDVLPDFDLMNGTTNTVFDTSAGTRALRSYPCDAGCTGDCNGAGLCGTCNTTTNVCTVPACTKAPCNRGGHAIAIVGFDDNQQAFKFVNSWGSGWDGNGYGWLSYSLITDPFLELVAFVMIDGPNTPGLQDSTMSWFESSRVLVF